MVQSPPAASRASLCLFVDLDRFKGINDQHGHLAGDHVLRQVADRLRNVVCKTAMVARVGGDEFIVLQAGSEPASAKDPGRSNSVGI